MTEGAGTAFWEFSLAVYARPGVPELLIDLQDRHGADVNLLLFCCWCGLAGRLPLDAGRLAEIDRQVADWRREVIGPLRALRRRMKGGVAGVPEAASEPIREAIKRLEIDCERLEQMRLAEVAPPVSGGGSAAAARAALEAYSGVLTGGSAGLPEAALDRLAAALLGAPTG